jgi:hypothetical protein
MQFETSILAEHEAPRKVLELKLLRVAGSAGITSCC